MGIGADVETAFIGVIVLLGLLVFPIAFLMALASGNIIAILIMLAFAIGFAGAASRHVRG